MFSTAAATVQSFWFMLTRPSLAITDPERRHRIRSLAATFLLTMVLSLGHILQSLGDGLVPPYLVVTLGASTIAFVGCRTRWYRPVALFGILVIAFVPSYVLTSAYSDTPTFVLASGRLLIMALLATYLLYSIRVSLLLAFAIALGFIMVPPPIQADEPPAYTALVFMILAGSIFFIFAITRQYEASERHIVQNALRASEERYRTIVEMQTEFICRWLPDQTVTFVNEAYCRYFGMRREDLLGSKVLALVYPDDIPYISQMIKSMSPSQPTVTYEHRTYNPAGELRWHQWTDLAIYDSEGQVIEYQSVGRDITELKRAEQAERQEREFAEALANTAALISSTLDLDEVLDRILDQVAAVNPLTTVEIILIENGEAYVARSRSHVDSSQYAALLSSRFVVSETRNLREMAATGKPVYIPDVREYDGWLHTQAADWMRSALGAPIRLEGETIGFLNMNSDKPGMFTHMHSARLQAFCDQAAIAIRNARMYDEVRHHAGELEALVNKRTAELELVTERQRVILDGTGDGIYYSEHNTIRYANAAFFKLTGYSPDELIGSDLFRLSPEENHAKFPAIRESLLTTGAWRGELMLIRKDESLLAVGLTINLLGTPSPTAPAVTVVRDISREKALHRQRSNLVAYASHELRTPITNLKTRLYLLRRRPENLEEHVSILDDVTERMQHLVEDLLDISRMEHGLIPIRHEAVDLLDVVESVITLQMPEAERKNLDLCPVLPAAPVPLTADRERLIQVVTNLVTNALNYTPAGGKVCVRLTTRDGCAMIEVEDTGIGISPEALPYIFQPFYRVVSEVEGSGLGLSIAREIVELHGGTLHVRSELKCGSTFTVSLPLALPAAAE